MPSLNLRLPPDLAAELHDYLLQLRQRAPLARITPASLVQDLLRAELRALRQARAHQLLGELATHPRKRGAGLPTRLQDEVLALIHRHGPLRERLTTELLRAGEWESQVSALARRWRQDGTSHEELCSAGMVGLMRAIKDWRPGPGWRSYAYMWIRKELERATRLGGSLVVESEHEARIRRQVEKGLRKGLSTEEIAKATGLSAEQVERGKQRRSLGWKELDGRRM